MKNLYCDATPIDHPDLLAEIGDTEKALHKANKKRRRNKKKGKKSKKLTRKIKKLTKRLQKLEQFLAICERKKMPTKGLGEVVLPHLIDAAPKLLDALLKSKRP